jgi:beta-carotene hydroxylase
MRSFFSNLANYDTLLAGFALFMPVKFAHSRAMTHADPLDQKAVAIARQYLGEVAWPTIVLGLSLVLTYVATVMMALTGVLSLWIAVPVVAILTYSSYTILHESVHGSISGNRNSLRWINKALGYVAAWIVMIPLTAHRHEHTAHHRYTNNEIRDPDFHIGQMRNSLPAMARAVVRAIVSQFRYYSENRWTKAPFKEKVHLGLEVAAAIMPRLTVMVSGHWVEGVALFVFGWMIGAIVLLYLFVYVVHRPHEQVGRYVDTSTILLPRPLHALITWLWLFQNYHSIHHLFPRVPFYKYAKLYGALEDIMLAKGAPIYRITIRGLKAAPPTLAN